MAEENRSRLDSLNERLAEVIRRYGSIANCTAQIVLALVALFLIVWPLHVWRHAHHYPYGEYGAWLQGVLTPALVTIAIVTWKSQLRAQRADEEAGRWANRLNASSLMLSHLHAFYGHVNYTSACAIAGHRPNDADVPGGNFQCVARLIRILAGQAPTLEDQEMAKTLAARPRSEIVKGEQYAILRDSLRHIIQLLEQANLGYLDDLRQRQRDDPNLLPSTATTASENRLS
jgi:hypothetical protein